MKKYILDQNQIDTLTTGNKKQRTEVLDRVATSHNTMGEMTAHIDISKRLIATYIGLPPLAKHATALYAFVATFD